MAVEIDQHLRGPALSTLSRLVAGLAEAPSELAPLDVLRAMEQVTSVAAAVQALAIASLADEAQRSAGLVTPDGRLVPDPEFVPDEVALALHCSPASAHRRCQLAKDAARHPALMFSWSAG